MRFWPLASMAPTQKPSKAWSNTRASASSTRSSPPCGAAAASCRSSTTSTSPTAGTGPRRCSTLARSTPFPSWRAAPCRWRSDGRTWSCLRPAAIEEAVSIHGGPFESYDFHGLEVLQAFIEARKGGETGVTQVEFLRGDALFKAAQQGRWSLDLARAAMRAELGDKVPDITRPINNAQPHGILLTLQDGTKATMLKLGASGMRWNFACKLAGERQPRVTSHYVGPWNNRCLFMALSHAIQHFFVTPRAPYPVERTLLTTGILEAAVRSRSRRAHRDAAFEYPL